MKKALLTILTFTHFFAAYAQKVINNTLSEKHTSITGTKISLISPLDFTKASNFQGLENGTGAFIMIVELPAPFSSTSSELTKEGLELKGVQVHNIERFTLNGMPAVLVTGQQKAFGITYTKYILNFGNKIESTILNGAFPIEYPELGAGIKASLLSAVYKADKKINPLDNVDFRINTDGTKLKVMSKLVVNTLIYTTDGLVPTQSEDKTTYLVGKSISEAEIGDKKAFTIDRAKRLPFGVTSIDTIQPMELDGLSGFELTATGKNPSSNAPLKLYQAIVFNGNLYYITQVAIIKL